MYLMITVFSFLLVFNNSVLSQTESDISNGTVEKNTTDAKENVSKYIPGEKAASKCREYGELFCPLLFSDTEASKFYKSIFTRRFVHGGITAEPKKYPHMTAIGYNSDKDKIVWLCGGSLISPNFILSAAHCCYSPEWGYAIWARLGDLNLSSDEDDAMPENYKIVERIKHPNYTAKAFYHDIALLRLEKDVTFNVYIRPACLLRPTDDVPLLATAIGWGRVNWDDDKGSEILLQVLLGFVDNKRCNSFYADEDSKLKHGVVADWQICAGENGVDTCQGDSGGPLNVCNEREHCLCFIFGITSIGKICDGLVPGIYTRVPYYLEWIENIVWP